MSNEGPPLKSNLFIGRAPHRRTTLTFALAVMLATLAPKVSSAHHSGAMWDSSTTLTLEGIVKEFQWSNPHCWIQLLVPDEAHPDAAPVEWGIEMPAPIQVRQGGWKPGTLKAGDRIRVSIHPARDGSPTGNFISAVSTDGRPLGTAT